MSLTPITNENRDIVAALCVVGIGLFGISDAVTHQFGVMRNIGPGAFPLIVSVIIVLTGILIFAESKFNNTPEIAQDGNSPRVLLFIVAGMLSFGLLAQRFGILPGIFACVTLTSMAENKLKAWQIIVVSIALSVFCALVFIYFLNLPLRLVRW